MAQALHALAVEARQVLVREPGIPLAAEGLDPGELSRDAHVHELGLQSQVESGRCDFTDQLTVEQAVRFGVDSFQVKPGDGAYGDGRSPLQDLLGELSGRKPERVDVVEGDEGPLPRERDVAALAGDRVEDDYPLGLVGVVGKAEGIG